MALDSDEVETRFLPCLGLFLARFCTSAWIGAASLFVVVGVTEVTRGGFDSATKDVLVAVRFPAFYVCGVVLIALGWIGAWVAGRSSSFPSTRRTSSLILLTLVLAIMAVDYIGIYQPLLQMVTPPGRVKSALFARYHEASKWINLAGLLLSMISAAVLNWPSNSRTVTRI